MADWFGPDDPRIVDLDQRPPRPQLLRWRFEPAPDQPNEDVEFVSEWDVDGEVKPVSAYWKDETLLADRGVWNSLMNIIKPGSAN